MNDKMQLIEEKIDESERVLTETDAMRDVAGANLAAESDKLKPIEEEEAEIKEKMYTTRQEIMRIQVRTPLSDLVCHLLISS